MTAPRLWIVAAAFGAQLAIGLVQAQAPPAAARPAGTIRALEQALETRGADVTLPAGGIGTVTVTPCARCKPVTMLAGSTSTWMLGDRAVAFDELRRALQSHPRAPVMVFYRGPGTELTRLIAQVPRTPAP